MLQAEHSIAIVIIRKWNMDEMFIDDLEDSTDYEDRDQAAVCTHDTFEDV